MGVDKKHFLRGGGPKKKGQSVVYLTGTRIDDRYIFYSNSAPEQVFEIMFGAPPYPNFM